MVCSPSREIKLIEREMGWNWNNLNWKNRISLNQRKVKFFNDGPNMCSRDTVKVTSRFRWINSSNLEWCLCYTDMSDYCPT